MLGKPTLLLAGATIALVSLSLAQRPTETPSWAPKQAPNPYVAPHKPLTRIADVKAAHAGQKEWRQLVVDDPHLHGEYVWSPVGAKTPRRFHPDTREWWVVLEGQIRFEIEGQKPFVAGKNAMVQVPMQTIYTMETVGDRPSLRWEVNIAKAKTLYPQDTTPVPVPGFTFMPVRLNRTPGPYDHGNVPLLDLDELAQRPEYKDKNFVHRFVHDDRGVSNVIYGDQKRMPPLNTKDKGHYHPECAEFWVIMKGQIRYPIEGQGVVIGSEGDIVYVPPFTFHAPRFWGDGPACRLAMNAYPNIAHLFDATPEK